MATPLYQQVAADIRRKIVSGEMPIGTQLQPHRELAVSYGVSVITINKALSGLVSDGTLHSRVGRGTFVAARPVVPDTHRILGFVLRDLSAPFFSLVAHAAQQRADELGYALLFSSTSNCIDREEEQLRRFRELGLRGLIVASMARTYRISGPMQELHDEGYPYVMVSYTHGDDVPFVGLDLNRAGFIATEHLISLGRRRIGYIGDRFGSILFEVRGSGYRDAMAKHGLAVDPELQFEYPFTGEVNDYRSGYAVGERVAAMDRKPDAMFVFNDLGALGFQDALLDHGIKVPEDIAIVGLDDIELAARARVPLTTVRQPTDRIGQAAVDTLVARLHGERPKTRQLFVPELVIRESCGAASGMGSRVTAARASPASPTVPARPAPAMPVSAAASQR